MSGAVGRAVRALAGELEGLLREKKGGGTGPSPDSGKKPAPGG